MGGGDLPPLMKKGKEDSVLRAGCRVGDSQRWPQAQEPKQGRGRAATPQFSLPFPLASSLHCPNHPAARRRQS